MVGFNIAYVCNNKYNNKKTFNIFGVFLSVYNISTCDFAFYAHFSTFFFEIPPVWFYKTFNKKSQICFTVHHSSAVNNL